MDQHDDDRDDDRDDDHDRGDDDRKLMNETTAAFYEVFCRDLANAVEVSPWATLTALKRVVSLLALDRVRAHPEVRDSEIASLRSMADFVEVETATKQ